MWSFCSDHTMLQESCCKEGPAAGPFCALCEVHHGLGLVVQALTQTNHFLEQSFTSEWLVRDSSTVPTGSIAVLATSLSIS